MSPSRQDYPSSLYPEVGSRYSRSDYGTNNSNISTVDGYSSTSRRNSSSYRSHGDYPRSRDHRHRDRNERHLRDAPPTNSRRGRSHSHERSREDRKASSNSSARSASNNNGNGNRSNSRTIKQRSRGIWEKFIPPDYRPSKADQDARRERLSKEHETEAFDWTPGFVLALMGAAALFSVEKSLIKRQKKDYIQH